MSGREPLQHVRGGLGRGLEAIIPRGRGAVLEVEIERIAPNPSQPRQYFDPDGLEELTASILEHGVLQPVIVSREGAGYTLIAGERRWRAAKAAGLKVIPALVKDASPHDAIVLALVENLQRADLGPLEEAAAYRTLVDEYSLTQEQLAGRVGRSRVAVANRLRLLALPPQAKSLLAKGSITEGHARALLACTDSLQLEALATRVVELGLSVRATEELVRRATRVTAPVLTENGPSVSAATAAEHGEVSALEEDLQRALGTRVQIVRGRRGGRVVVHYYDEDQLGGLVEFLLGQAGSD